MAKTETGLLLAPQLKAMLDSEAYHYCADCHTHCRQTILAVEAAKEAVKAHAADAEQLHELRRAAQSALEWIDELLHGRQLTEQGDTVTARLRAVLKLEKETQGK